MWARVGGLGSSDTREAFLSLQEIDLLLLPEFTFLYEMNIAKLT